MQQADVVSLPNELEDPEMMTCPSCNASEGVQIEEDPLGQAHWAGRCEPCGHHWTFSDDL